MSKEGLEIEEGKAERGQPYPTLGLFSEALSRRMSISPADKTELLDSVNLRIPDWANKVTINPDLPPVRARIDRLGVSFAISSDTRIPEKMKDASLGQALTALAIYDAKLITLNEEAPEYVTKSEFSLARERRKVRNQMIDILKSARPEGKTLKRRTLKDIFRNLPKPKIASAAATISLALAACQGIPIQHPTPEVTQTLQVEISPTLETPTTDKITGVEVAATATPTTKPTQTATPELSPTPTQAATATTEATKINEKELNPAYTETVSQKYMGVQINAELITDKSIYPNIKKITMPPNAYAEFIARTIFDVWWVNSTTSPRGPSTEKDFADFMALWAKAQESNNPADWYKLQIPDIWANDLNDGNGYKLQPYTIQFMSNGHAPEGLREINEFSIAIVNSGSIKNLTILENSLAYMAYGTNLDQDTLFLYIDASYAFVSAFSSDHQLLTQGISGAIAGTPSWLLTKNGIIKTKNGFLPNGLAISLSKFLLSNGFALYQ